MKTHQDAHRIFDGLYQLMQQMHDKVSKSEARTGAEFIALGEEVNLVIASYNMEMDNLMKLNDGGPAFCIGLLETLHSIQRIAVMMGIALSELSKKVGYIETGKMAFVDMLGDKPKSRTWN